MPWQLPQTLLEELTALPRLPSWILGKDRKGEGEVKRNDNRKRKQEKRGEKGEGDGKRGGLGINLMHFDFRTLTTMYKLLVKFHISTVCNCR